MVPVIKVVNVHGAPPDAHGCSVQMRARMLEVRSDLSYGTFFGFSFLPRVSPGVMNGKPLRG